MHSTIYNSPPGVSSASCSCLVLIGLPNRNVSVTENDERTVSLIKEVRDCVFSKDVEIECLSQAESLAESLAPTDLLM